MGENNEIEKALDRYRKAAEKDKELRKYGSQAVKGTADLATAQNYSRRAGEISSNVLEDVLQGVEDEATRKQVISAVLKENYKNVIANTEAVQRSANESAGVGLNPILADYDAGIADEISNSISRYEDVEAGISAVANDIVVQSQKYADSSMRKNAEFQNNSGMEVLVTREYDDVGVHTTDKGGGEVCQWCLSRCGTDVPYDEAYQRGMFERHPGCGCVITYKTKKGTFRQGRGDWETNNWNKHESDDIISKVEAMQYKTEYKENIGQELRKIIGEKIDGIEIKKVSHHFYDQAYSRKVNPLDIIDAIKNSLKIGDIKVNKDGKSSFQIIGKSATVYLDPDSGVITTVHKTHTKLAEKLMKGKRQ